MCLYDITYKIEERPFFVYKTLKSPVIIPDYISTAQKEKPIEKVQQEYDSLVIERRRHICQDSEFVRNFRTLFVCENPEFLDCYSGNHCYPTLDSFVRLCSRLMKEGDYETLTEEEIKD